MLWLCMFCKEFIKGRLFKTLEAKFALYIEEKEGKMPEAHFGIGVKVKGG